MKKSLLILCCSAVIILFAGCKSSSFRADGLPANEATIVTVKSAAPAAKETYGKKFWIEPAAGWEKHEYSAETKTYLTRGLNYLGYELAAVKNKADFIVVYSFKSEDRLRRDAYMSVWFLKNVKDGGKLWDATSHCSFRKDRSYRPMLPGLAGGVLLYVGRNGGGRTKLSNFKSMMNAVEGLK